MKSIELANEARTVIKNFLNEENIVYTDRFGEFEIELERDDQERITQETLHLAYEGNEIKKVIDKLRKGIKEDVNNGIRVSDGIFSISIEERAPTANWSNIFEDLEEQGDKIILETIDGKRREFSPKKFKKTMEAEYKKYGANPTEIMTINKKS